MSEGSEGPRNRYQCGFYRGASRYGVGPFAAWASDTVPVPKPERVRPMVSRNLRGRLYVFDMVHGPSVTFICRVDLDLVASLERAAFQMRGFIDMQAHFVASRIMHGIKLPLNLQHVPFDNFRARCFHLTPRG